jgi:hypothetical protein
MSRNIIEKKAPTENSDSIVNKYQIREIMKILDEMEYGIQLVKEEFKLGMHLSVQSIIKKVDQIMTAIWRRKS